MAAVGDAMPSPWGDRIEIVLRELGGFIWVQIAVLFIPIILSSTATGWRYPRCPTLKARERFPSVPVFLVAPVADRAISIIGGL